MPVMSRRATPSTAPAATQSGELLFERVGAQCLVEAALVLSQWPDFTGLPGVVLAIRAGSRWASRSEIPDEAAIL